jgi:hypothetical protein
MGREGKGGEGRRKDNGLALPSIRDDYLHNLCDMPWEMRM